MAQALPQELMALIQGGENLTTEFKKSRTEITKEVYESVCAFSNRNGGHIFLGVKDESRFFTFASRFRRMSADAMAASMTETMNRI